MKFRLNRSVEEILYPAMEDYALDIIIGKGPSARSIRLDLPRFTLIENHPCRHADFTPSGPLWSHQPPGIVFA